MPANMVKIGLLVFVVLAATVTANVMALQPIGRRAIGPATKAAAPVETATVPEKADVSKAGPAVLNGEKAPDLEGAVRRELGLRGYAPGEGDFSGLEARAAILAFESDAGLPLTGRVRSELLQQLLFGVARNAPMVDAMPASAEVSRDAREVIAAAQRSLALLGYKLEANGLPSLETQKAIREFEAYYKLPVTGRVSGRLMAQLAQVSKLDHGPVAVDKLRARVASQH